MTDEMKKKYKEEYSGILDLIKPEKESKDFDKALNKFFGADSKDLEKDYEGYDLVSTSVDEME